MSSSSHNRNIFIFLGILLCSSLVYSCKEVLTHNKVKDVVLEGNAQPVVRDGWRKMGDFFNENANVEYLFVIKGKAYFKITMLYQELESDFWAYDPATNTFSPKKALPTKNGGSLYMAIGNKGYYGPGLTFYEGVYTNSNEFWEYNPDNDTWNRKADFIADDINFPGVFVVDNIAYVCGWQGKDGYRQVPDVYQYNSVADVWSKKNARYSLNPYLSTTLQFNVNGKGYLFGGSNGKLDINKLIDSLYSTTYDPNNNKFSVVRNTTFPYDYVPQTSWTLKDKIYLYCGGTNYSSADNTNEIWEFNTASLTWRKIKDFGGPIRPLSFGFSIGDKAYICFGRSGDSGKSFYDVWEYNP